MSDIKIPIDFGYQTLLFLAQHKNFIGSET